MKPFSTLNAIFKKAKANKQNKDYKGRKKMYYSLKAVKMIALGIWKNWVLSARIAIYESDFAMASLRKKDGRKNMALRMETKKRLCLIRHNETF